MIDTIEIKQGSADDQITVTMRGDVTMIAQALIHGVGKENLLMLKDALDRELARRAIDAHESDSRR